jgi:hypothetical protein
MQGQWLTYRYAGSAVDSYNRHAGSEVDSYIDMQGQRLTVIAMCRVSVFDIHSTAKDISCAYVIQKCWTVWGSNPGGGQIFPTRLDRPWGPSSLLYKGYRVSFPGVKRPGRGVNQVPPPSAEVKERVELYLDFPSGPSWPVSWRTLPFCVSKVCRFVSQSLPVEPSYEVSALFL